MLTEILLGTNVILLLWIGMLFINTFFYVYTGKMLLLIAPSIGASMEPAIPRGITLMLKRWPGTIEEGDVVTYVDEEGDRICHRVTKIKGDEAFIQGDNNHVPDGWYYLDEIESKIVSYNQQPVYLPVGYESIKRTINGESS